MKEIIQTLKWKWLLLSMTMALAILVGVGVWYLKVQDESYLSQYRVDERHVYFESELLNTKTHSDVNGFSWREGRVYQDGKLYTGWFRGTTNQFNYVAKGVVQPNMTVSESKNMQLGLGGSVAFALPRTAPIVKVENRQEVQYSILYRGVGNIVLADIPGLKSASLVSAPVTFVDLPMEVVEEAIINGKVWLHVYVGYSDLGWIQQDQTYTSYVQTDYSERELLDAIEAILYQELDAIEGIVGASFIHNETMEQVDVYNQVFFPASTQKIYVLAELYRQYKEGKINPEDEVIMYDDNMVPGAGVIASFGEGSIFTVDQLVDMVAIYSDNTAANMLIDIVGGGAVITPHTQAMGMTDTYVDGKYYYTDNRLFQTTPHDATLLLAKLANRQLNGEPWDSMLIHKLKMNTHSFLRTFLYDVDSWNKSGLGEPEQNDVATFITEYGGYTIAIYTNSWTNINNRFEQVGYLSYRVYEAFLDIRSKLWHSETPNVITAGETNE